MTVLLGPTPCRGCRRPVTVVRRPVLLRFEVATGSNQYRRRTKVIEVRAPDAYRVATTDADGDHRCGRAT